MELGIPERDFWEMTPRQFQLIANKHLNQLRRMGYKTAAPATGMGPEVYRSFVEAFNG